MLSPRAAGSRRSSLVPQTKLQMVTKDLKTTEDVFGDLLKKVLDSIEPGDTIPEAEIVCNIIDKLERNISLVSVVANYCKHKESKTEDPHPLDADIGDRSRLKRAMQILLGLFKEIILEKSKNKLKKIKPEDEVISTRIPGPKSASNDPKETLQKKEERFQFMARDVVFYLVHEIGCDVNGFLGKCPKDQQVEDFLKTFKLFKGYARSLIARPRNTTLKEEEILLQKVSLREGFEKVLNELENDLQVLLSSRNTILGSREIEGKDLRNKIEECQNESSVNIEEIRKETLCK
ncbi:uncharacterized protein LOC111703511 [Eurytemora carolleeae]|uniref:uncharacterized protein LOC111703511 n=1 Tax=Eurytemora carolleeae TaxID=1294199 RepID=UPI000C7778DD|nr:uncharacterized protein LOC111703511 [Eurytemora carolleeae]|eukprot:XP_023331235.1 uncharacterized protein LOC111703511 [Eurytemora affinis]